MIPVPVDRYQDFNVLQEWSTPSVRYAVDDHWPYGRFRTCHVVKSSRLIVDREVHACSSIGTFMALHRRLDKYRLIQHLLHDIYRCHGAVFNYSSLCLTLGKVRDRLSSEGDGFLTKTLPKLGKAFDKALAGGAPLNATKLRFKSRPGSELPMLMGEFFSRVLDPTGRLLPEPCTMSVAIVRQFCYLFYKYELPYSVELEQQVIARFIETESELSSVSERLNELETLIGDPHLDWSQFLSRNAQPRVARRARGLLKALFARFDPLDIIPRHGPGAVSTKEQLWEKYEWTNVSAKITRVYPLDAYFYASLGHVCDRLESINSIGIRDLPARVCLVPKDSRGPRLISCEPVDYQWVQQGLGRAIVDWVESHTLTKFNVHFTDQTPNQIGALSGSRTGRYATLDLKDASDRVSLALVRLLFPPRLYEFLESCRSSATELPDGLILPLWKFAPMGSCLCFSIMALTIWAILTAAAPDAYTRERILVYGDDVVVPTAFAEDAMEQLESFGLKVNRDKSCIRGSFRESCGVDAFKDVNVTPIKLRTVWSPSRSPESYVSWVAYANAFWHRKYYATYDYIVGLLADLYQPLVTWDQGLPCPSLPLVPEKAQVARRRTNPKGLQRLEWKVLVADSPKLRHVSDGWEMLLRYFVEKAAPANKTAEDDGSWTYFDRFTESFSVSSYTRRRDSKLSFKWVAYHPSHVARHSLNVERNTTASAAMRE